MSLELVFSAANLLVVIGYFMKMESRMTKLETKVDFLMNNMEKRRGA